MNWINPTPKQILDEVKVLVDKGNNTEYTRGVLEIISSFIDCKTMCHADKVIELANNIGLSKETISKLY